MKGVKHEDRCGTAGWQGTGGAQEPRPCCPGRASGGLREVSGGDLSGGLLGWAGEKDTEEIF